ncbi:MAG: DNA polymerase, partial [Patescibacteria group bacterium]
NLYAVLEQHEKKKRFPEGISAKLAEKLLAHKDQAFFSKRLGTIVTNLDIPFTLENADWRTHLNPGELDRTLKDFGFFSLIKRLGELKIERPANDTVATVHEPVTDADGTLIAHDAKPYIRDLLVHRKGIPPLLFDTKVGAYLLKPGERTYDFEALLHEHNIPPDTNALHALRDKLARNMQEAEVMRIFEDIEMPLVKVLAQMELDGISVDTKILQRLRKKAEDQVADLEKKIYTLAGGQFNISSPQQLGRVLFEQLGLQGKVRRTSGGALSTAAPELEKLRDAHPIIDRIFEYREIQKLLTTYIEPFPDLIGHDMRIHTTYNQVGAATGRLASENPNLQNIPVKTDLGHEFRRAFIAPKGTQLVSLDYSQLELRIVAHIAEDKKMMAAFERGEDIHTRTAAQVFGVVPAKVTKEMRNQAKVLNFGIIYGMGSLGFARAAGVDRAQAKEFIDRYFEEFSGIAHYMEAMKNMAYQKGYVKTIFGRRRPLPDARSTMPQLRAQAERMAINHPVQGTEADLIKMAMVRIYDFLEHKGLRDRVRMLLQVHDELVFEIASDAVAVVVPQLTQIMESVYRLSVPLVVDAKAGNNWADMHPIP